MSCPERRGEEYNVPRREWSRSISFEPVGFWASLALSKVLAFCEAAQGLFPWEFAGCSLVLQSPGVCVLVIGCLIVLLTAALVCFNTSNRKIHLCRPKRWQTRSSDSSKKIPVKIALHGGEQKSVEADVRYLIGLVFYSLLSQTNSSEIRHYAAFLIYEVGNYSPKVHGFNPHCWCDLMAVRWSCRI